MNDKIILLADDDADDRFFVQQAIASSGVSVKVIEVENGLELITFLKNNLVPISLILVDMNMPKMNGLEAISQIKAIPSSADVPVVMISTSPHQSLAEKAYQNGVTSFMPKPNTFDEFTDLIMSLYKRFLS
ncbi:response regulator [Dyadobacter luticola]|uniref:Response regulator n=1 Tax=Dyadobacter luticola TaxID=1979387 RepID=A0A5R9L0X8_9BACT|nr:response regulator [Dyadobacter luticola]TLV02192.1 response regulator [Dyadobacter luticola]